MRLRKKSIPSTMTPNPDQSESTTPAVTSFTRRTFLKTSALTVGAVAVLSQGRAMADENDISSSIFHKHKCDNSCPPVTTGILKQDVWGKVEEPAGSGSYQYFPLYNCQCVKDKPPLGVHRGPKQATPPAPGVFTREYGGTSGWGAVPSEHTPGHS